MSKSILEIKTFGGTAAEDDDLKRFFVRTPAFDQIWDGSKNIVIGRKGSGKTALYLALGDRATRDGDQAASLSFAQYPWQAHYRYSASAVTSTERFVESWRFLILAEALSLMVQRPADGLARPESRALGQVQKFLEDNYGTVHFDFKQAFPEGGLSVDALEAEPSVAGVKIGKASAGRRGQALGNNLGRVNDWLFNKARIVSSKFGPIYVLFDELDLGYDPDDEDYRDRVIGLLLAARRFATDSSSSQLNIRPVVFLRSDIFDRLHFGDKNKIRNANSIELVWHDRLDYTEASLSHLIDWRIKEALGLETDVSEAWSHAFDDQVTRGTQHKFQHITFRTLLRPRDVIQFANVALQQAQNRIRLEAGAVPLISNEDLKAARQAYSNYFRLEFDDEIGEAFPEWESLLEILRSIGSSKFGPEDFKRGYEQASGKTKVPLTLSETLPFLYNYSIIGFEKTRPSGSGFTYHFKYQGDSVRFDPQAGSFLVHRGLKETLDLTETG